MELQGLGLQQHKYTFSTAFNTPTYLLIVSLILATSVDIFGQNEDAAGLYNGYVVSNNNDTLLGAVELGSAALRTVRIIFTDYETRQPIELEPFQIKSYYANGKTYDSKVYDIDAKLDYGYAVFMERIEGGNVNLYKFWNNNRKRFEVILTSEGTKMTLVNRIRFRKQMTAYFKNNPELSAKIVRNVYNFEDLPAMVREHNQWKVTQ